MSYEVMEGMSQKRAARNFTDLIVWQKSHQLMLDCYKFLELLPKEEKYNRISQLKGSSSSTPANIAEGFGRYHFQENIQFCRQARGSLAETANHIIAARDLRQAPPDQCGRLLDQCEEVRILLNSYIRGIKNSKDLYDL